MKRVFIFTALILTGCSINPYSKHFTDMTNGTYVNLKGQVEPKIMFTSDSKKDVDELMRNNYAMLGYSSFLGGDFDENMAVEVAQTIKADLILYSKIFSHSTSGVMPLTLPNTQISSVDYSGTMLSSRGASASYYGSGTITTQGIQTTYIPYSTRYYEHDVSYWRKVDNVVLGLVVLELSESHKKQINSNKGVYVRLVRKQTPAYNADIIDGDIVKKIGEYEISDMNSYNNAVDKYTGLETSIELLRDSKPLIKRIKLNPR